MSHFCVAVVTKNNNREEIEKLLEPYWEEKRVEPYLYRTKAELIHDAKEYQKVLKEHFKNNPNDTVSDYQQECLSAKSDEDFYNVARTESDEYYDEEGNELTTYNQNSKWDWYSIGGRFNSSVIIDKENTDCYEQGDWGMGMNLDTTVKDHPELKRVNGARIKDIHFDLMGWWAMHDATKDSRSSFVDKFQEYITAPEHQEEYLFLVDCHI